MTFSMQIELVWYESVLFGTKNENYSVVVRIDTYITV